MKTLRDRSLATEAFPAEAAAQGRRARRAGRSTRDDQGELGRVLLSQSAAWTFLGLTLGVFVSRKFFILPLAVAFTLTQELVKHRLEKRYGQ